MIAEKIRILIRHLDKKFLCEKETPKHNSMCECGFMLLGQEYESCPVCDKKLHMGKECFYKDESFCTQDGKECVWSTYYECGKMKL